MPVPYALNPRPTLQPPNLLKQPLMQRVISLRGRAHILVFGYTRLLGSHAGLFGRAILRPLQGPFAGLCSIGGRAGHQHRLSPAWQNPNLGLSCSRVDGSGVSGPAWLLLSEMLGRVTSVSVLRVKGRSFTAYVWGIPAEPAFAVYHLGWQIAGLCCVWLPGWLPAPAPPCTAQTQL